MCFPCRGVQFIKLAVPGQRLMRARSIAGLGVIELPPRMGVASDLDDGDRAGRLVMLLVVLPPRR
jgi:hypothetical protein